MYRLREMDLDDKVCEQVDLTLLAQVYPAFGDRAVRWAESGLGQQSAAGAAEYEAFLGAVCDRDGGFRAGFPNAWCGTNWSASSALCIPGSRRASPSASALSGRRKALGKKSLAGTDARVLSGAGAAADDAQRLLWSLSAHGH